MENKDMFDSEWEQDIVPQKEIQQIQKSIRKRNWKIIAISVALTAAVLLGCVYGVIPLIESLYWNPNTMTVASNANDLTLMLHAYTELFTPGWQVNYASVLPSDGLASYDLSISIRNVQTRDFFYLDGTLNKGEISLDREYTQNYVNWTLFGQEFGQTDDMRKSHMQQVRETLESLPEYVSVKAAIRFPEDLTMQQLSDFYYAYHPNNSEMPIEIQWVGIRNEPEGENFLRLCGMSPFIGGTGFFGLEESYPNFTCSVYKRNAAHLDEHFTSILRYSSDQFAQGTGMPVYWEMNYYQTVLDYVAENGIMTYGGFVITTPQTLLSLLEDGTICYITLTDAWIDVG